MANAAFNIAKVNLILPQLIATRIAQRSIVADLLATPTAFRRLSLRHGRSLSTPLTDGRSLSVKGCGWTWGPPWVALSPKDAQLCFGLLDLAAAHRDVNVGVWLERQGVDCARCVQVLELNEDELRTLGVPASITFQDGMAIRPAVLLTATRSPWRLADLCSEGREEAITALCQIHESSDTTVVLRGLTRRLTGAVARYQELGAVNDTLNPENVTLAGEIIDFEWMWVPGIPTPDGSRDENLTARQRKEGYYLVECLLVASSAFGLPWTVQRAARFAMESLAEEYPSIGLTQQLCDLA